MVRISQVVEDGEIDGEDAHGGAPDCDCRADPVDVWEGGPAEPEQADGHEDAFEADEVEARFGGAGEEVEAAGDLFLVDADDGDEEGADAHCCLVWLV